MIDPHELGGVRIEALPVALEYVRDIEAFEGPLLSEFKSNTGETFLYHWCDRNSDFTRWLVVRTPRQDLTRYLVGVINLRQLIRDCRDQAVYLVDSSPNGAVHATFFIPVEHLPVDYMPTDDSFYRSVDVPREERQTKYQDVYINDGDWGYPELTEYPRKYLQTYSVHAIFGIHGDASALPPIDYKLNQGWVYHTLFAKFGSHVPADKQASLDSVAVASPGYVRFHVDPAVAASVRKAVGRFLADRDMIVGEAALLRKWANGHEPMPDPQVTRRLQDLCETLGLRSDELLQRTDALPTAVKALLSYLTRLTFLADKDHEKGAMLVGLQRPPALA